MTHSRPCWGSTSVASWPTGCCLRDSGHGRSTARWICLPTLISKAGPMVEERRAALSPDDSRPPIPVRNGDPPARCDDRMRDSSQNPTGRPWPTLPSGQSGRGRPTTRRPTSTSVPCRHPRHQWIGSWAPAAVLSVVNQPGAAVRCHVERRVVCFRDVALGDEVVLPRLLSDGDRLLIHCRGGIGRLEAWATPMMAMSSTPVIALPGDCHTWPPASWQTSNQGCRTGRRLPRTAQDPWSLRS